MRKFALSAFAGLAALAGSVPANAAEVALACIFGKTPPGVKPAQFFELAILIPHWPVDDITSTFDMIDPDKMLGGKQFTSFLNGQAIDENGMALLTSAESSPRYALILKPKLGAPAGLFEATFGELKERPKIGQCGAIGQNPRESMEFWKLNPDKIGEGP